MQPYLETLAAVIEDPASNLTAAVLLLAAVFLILLIVVVLVLVFLAPSHRAPEGRQADGDHRRSTPGPKKRGLLSRGLRRLNSLWDSTPGRTRLIVSIALLALSVAGTYAATGTASYCTENCHQMEPAVETWAESSHSAVRCVRCHEGRPVASAATALVARSGYVIGSLSGGQPDEVTIPGSRCLQCHAAVLEGSLETTGGLRMDHAAPVAAGVSCEECHPDTGHAKERPSRPSRMQVCLRCHDDAIAPSVCETCHAGDVGNQPVFTRMYRKTGLPQPTCGGCHDETSCDACHGLRMPHSQGFIEGEHAPLAAFERKESCWRCHRECDCGQCHGQFQSGHGDTAAFRQQHKSLPWNSACNGCHPNHEGSFCQRCH